MDSGIQPVMNVGATHDGYNGFMGDGIWLFAILALFGLGGNGFWGRGTGERCATVEDLASQSNFTRLEGQVRANENLIQSGFTNLGNGICSLGYQNARDFGATQTQLSQCCCDINRNIDALRYETALNTSAINANTTAGIQKVLDTLCADKMAAQQARISQLELNQALCGVIRYPTMATYSAGYPFMHQYGCGCGCGYQPSI